MSETYVECLVKKEASVIAKFIRMVLFMITGMFALIGLLFPIMFFGALLTGLCAYFVNQNTDLEYEYLYLDKELTIDVIKAKAKRKRVATYEIERLEILAPIHSYHLDGYKNRNAKAIDYSIGYIEKPDRRYVLFYNGNEKIIFSPSEELVKAIRNVAPRKVFMD